MENINAQGASEINGGGKADLREANLRGAKSILSIGPIGSRQSIFYVVNHGDKIMIYCGCFWGELNKFICRVKYYHVYNQHGKAYAAAIDFIKAYASAYWMETENQENIKEKENDL